MKMPCEIIGKKYFPAVRNILAYELVEVKGYTQIEAAKALNVTQAAIAQYLKKIRGDKSTKEIFSDKEIVFEIKQLSNDIHKLNDEQKVKRMCDICYIIRKNNHLEKYGIPYSTAMNICPHKK